MPFLTDERLKSYLDTNQLAREQLCLAVLAGQPRYSDVRPRHPRGGPDGGRDIEARYQGSLRAFGAVGFFNQANDSAEQKRRVKEKFRDDLEVALTADPKPEVFVFFTNVSLTVGEKEELIGLARAADISYSEIFDRERIRIALDDVNGLATRFQYLGIPLSEAEQASFFSRWGDDIQSVISTGFQRVERTLERLLFLQEAGRVLHSFTISLQLDRIYTGDEIGHFRAFCLMHLREPKHTIWGIIFGSSDKARRTRSPSERDPPDLPGIKHGISGGNWEQYVDFETPENSDAPSDTQEKYQLTSQSSGVGLDPVEFVTLRYNHDDSIIRFRPRLTLRDLDEVTVMPVMNRALAEKLGAIHIYANGYKLREIKKVDFSIDDTPFDPEIPAEFTTEELADPWVRIRPAGYVSVFSLSFADRTPSRLFSAEPISDSLAARRGV